VQSSVLSNLTKQRNQEEQQHTDASDSSISQFHSQFQSESNNLSFFQYPNGDLTSQQFQVCLKAADTIQTDVHHRYQVAELFQTPKGQEGILKGKADPNPVGEVA
jgi:hypothetical protein